MTAVTDLATARTRRAPARRTTRHQPVIETSVDVALLRISRHLAAHAITVREATEQIHTLYAKTEIARARRQVAGMPGPLAQAHIYAEAARVASDVLTDEYASAVPLALAERRLGEVLLLPCGQSVGASTAPEKPYDRPEDLW